MPVPPFRFATLALALPLLVLAGCTSPDGPAPSEGPGVEPASSGPGGASAPPSTLPEALVGVPFFFEGNIPSYAEACVWVAAVGTDCVYGPPTGDFRLRTDPDLDGHPVAMVLNATWHATSAATEELVLFVGAHSGKAWIGLGWRMGGSPLSWETSLEVPEGYTLHVGLAAPSRGEFLPVAGAWASGNPLDQPFVLDGVFTVRPLS